MSEWNLWNVGRLRFSVSILTLFSNCYYFEGLWSVGERSFVAGLLLDAVFVPFFNGICL